MTEEQKAAATKEWETTIKSFFTPGDRGGMLNMTYIHPRLDLWNMESVVLHAYYADNSNPDENVAGATFEDDPFIYPPDIRTPGSDFNWKDGIINRVKSGNMPSGGPRWTEERCTTFETWVEKYWPPKDPQHLV